MDNHLYLGWCLTWVSERASFHRGGCGGCTVSRACLGRHVAATLAMWLLLLCPIPCLAARVCWPFGSVRVSPPARGGLYAVIGVGGGLGRAAGGLLGGWGTGGRRVASGFWWRALAGGGCFQTSLAVLRAPPNFQGNIMIQPPHLIGLAKL